MTQLKATGLTEVRVEATVLRCRCGNPNSHTGAVCPNARVETIGTVGYIHRNPIKNFIGNAYIALRGGVRKLKEVYRAIRNY